MSMGLKFVGCKSPKFWAGWEISSFIDSVLKWKVESISCDALISRLIGHTGGTQET